MTFFTQEKTVSLTAKARTTLVALETRSLIGAPRDRCAAIVEALRLTCRAPSGPFERFVDKWRRAPMAPCRAAVWGLLLDIGLRTERAQAVAEAERTRAPGFVADYLLGCAGASRAVRIRMLRRVVGGLTRGRVGGLLDGTRASESGDEVPDGMRLMLSAVSRLLSEGARLDSAEVFRSLKRKDVERVGATLRPRLILHGLLYTKGYRRTGLLDSLLSLSNAEADAPLRASVWETVSCFVDCAEPTELEWERIAAACEAALVTQGVELQRCKASSKEIVAAAKARGWGCGVQASARDALLALRANLRTDRAPASLRDVGWSPVALAYYAEALRHDSLAPDVLALLGRLFRPEQKRVGSPLQGPMSPRSPMSPRDGVELLRLSLVMQGSASALKYAGALTGLDPRPVRLDQAQLLMRLESLWDATENADSADGTPLSRGAIDVLVNGLPGTGGQS